MAKKGIDFVINVNTGTDALSVWTKVGGQRGASLSRSADTFEATTKDSLGWKEFEAGFKEWSIEADGLVLTSDVAYTALETAYTTGAKVKVQIEDGSGSDYAGFAIVTDLPIDMPYDDLVTYSCTLQGTGALEKTV